MILTTAGDKPGLAGLRAMDPARDLSPVANLIAEAFAGDLDRRAQAVLREMRWMARLSPLVWWMAQADPEFRDNLSGFVWEQPDARRGRPQIVGNVSLNRAPGNRRRWIICNVAVKVEWRRQGIARQLTQAAITEARKMGAEGVVLQAYQGNVAAVRMYTELGFQAVAGETDLRLAEMAPAPIQAAAGYTIRPWRPVDGSSAYELVRLATPAVLQWMEPVQAEKYRMGPWLLLAETLGDRFARRRTHRLVACQDEHLAALLIVKAASREPAHQLKLFVPQAHRGQVEGALIGQALHSLRGLPPRPVWAVVDKDHDAARVILRGLGFKERRTLLLMTQNF